MLINGVVHTCQALAPLVMILLYVIGHLALPLH